eukprot:m.179399 g.179399  ORF g.179399 m.179399 type:complete len:638 (+) comp31973_c0_seq1:195-2108(+)
MANRARSSDQQLTTLCLCMVLALVLLVPWPFRSRWRSEENRNSEDGIETLAVDEQIALKLTNQLSRDHSENYIGHAPWRKHGIIGRSSAGESLFQYSEDPGPIKDKEADLKQHGFYERLSNSISLDRNVTDHRDAQCQKLPEDDFDTLPQTSVVFVFYNEAMSTLLRSIHSVLNRTPPQLLKEIILIDDGSSLEHLKEPLERYIAKLPKVRLVRQPSRKGLVQARLKGAEIATAETFTVLDSHIEVQPGWLPPLMRRMKDHPERVLMPMIDSTNPETFQHHNGGIGCSLGFLWDLTEHSIPTQPEDEKRRTSQIDYIRSPTMAGGLFTVNRDFFWHLGGYDTDFSYWGTENLEFSFRIWQCGGTLECSPCSRVYHIFRGHHPYSLPPNSITKNKLRTAAIWMDEYAIIAQNAIGNPGIDIGPLDQMLALRKRLECKPFSWYMQEVYPTNFFSDMRELMAIGDIKTATNQCLDSLNHNQIGQAIGVYGCHGQGGTQAFTMSRTEGFIMPVGNLEICLLSSLSFGICNSAASWSFNDKGYLVNERTNECLAIVTQPSPRLAMHPCDTVSEHTDMVWQLHMREEPKHLADMHIIEAQSHNIALANTNSSKNHTDARALEKKKKTVSREKRRSVAKIDPKK